MYNELCTFIHVYYTPYFFLMSAYLHVLLWNICSVIIFFCYIFILFSLCFSTLQPTHEFL